ncbi:Histone-lysine N-methyltransferase [Phytophthora citrophthora]|uniref:Histone-lysine N-methyltransferase, H3 lysine-79 specific n=1 Tax=Phytophthora citrophthora TaxID=4793 RepID=A0AAD9GUZ4_9STRA|nr:Histone-lysine N-methyltransferase [Phytophthora citrophthora]
MTPRRRPANRKGPRSVEHRKLSSPQMLSPRRLCDSPVSSSSSLDMPEASYPCKEIAEESIKEVVKLEDAMSSSDEAMTAASAAIELVVLKLEEAEEAGTAASSGSDGETTAMIQVAQQGLLKQDAETQELRRSRRKRRKVDVLSPSQDLATSRKATRNLDRVKVQALLNCRPAAAATAAARAAAASREKKRKATLLRQKRASAVKAAKKEKTLDGVLSPVQDEKKTTPKKRHRKTRRPLEPVYSFQTETDYMAELIAELYEEQEQDDREMYSITRDTVVTETSSCKRSQEVDDLSMEDFRRLMTYGEVSVTSVANKILPLFNLDDDDVFFDLGCGTGKILVQAALQTPCKRAIGIELMQNRVLEGQKALDRLKERNLATLDGKQIEIFRGDMFVPPEAARLVDATVVFINNVMFGPQLMLKVLHLFNTLPKLRCVMTLRKICERHGHEKCSRAGNYCVDYVQPPIEEEIDVSWADKSSVYFYESVDFKVKQLTLELASGAHQVKKAR